MGSKWKDNLPKRPTGLVSRVLISKRSSTAPVIFFPCKVSREYYCMEAKKINLLKHLDPFFVTNFI